MTAHRNALEFWRSVLADLPRLPGALCASVELSGLDPAAWDSDASETDRRLAARTCALCPERGACGDWYDHQSARRPTGTVAGIYHPASERRWHRDSSTVPLPASASATAGTATARRPRRVGLDPVKLEAKVKRYAAGHREQRAAAARQRRARLRDEAALLASWSLAQRGVPCSASWAAATVASSSSSSTVVGGGDGSSVAGKGLY